MRVFDEDSQVVSYRNSTSNHNIIPCCSLICRVVSYRNSTSNHNAGDGYPVASLLYLIEILHQTTTISVKRRARTTLYLIEILHQTTTITEAIEKYDCCILSKFYIKPQLYAQEQENTNGCILSKFYIKPQPTARPRSTPRSCILSKFYIKPQLVANVKTVCVVVSYRNSTSNHNNEAARCTVVKVVSYRNSTSNHNCFRFVYIYLTVVSYRNSTSNHNSDSSASLLVVLYLIEILHQTTTKCSASAAVIRCILSKFYIKPQQRPFLPLSLHRCILSKFYIKPQPRSAFRRNECVVSYRNSTSNHNITISRSVSIMLYLIEILHQTTTPPRNIYCL